MHAIDQSVRFEAGGVILDADITFPGLRGASCCSHTGAAAVGTVRATAAGTALALPP